MAKLRAASDEEILDAGAVPGYASPVGLPSAEVIVDDLIPRSPNLTAGANKPGYHLLNTNHGRDYQSHAIADLTQAQPGDPCTICGASLEAAAAYLLSDTQGPRYQVVLRALADTHHDEHGLSFPPSVAPFAVHLLHLTSSSLDTRSVAQGFYHALAASGTSVLFDDRDARAGVKFNDADLIGCPLRVTIGERDLAIGMVELKARKAGSMQKIPLADAAAAIRSFTLANP
jgi:prolyl-tRNA synthetase